MLYRSLFFILLFACVLSSCSGKQDAKHGKDYKEVSVSEIELLAEAFDYSDTASLHNRNILTRHIADMTELTAVSDSAAVANAFTTFFKSVREDEKALSLALDIIEENLNNPASPARNEDIYITWLSSLLSIDSVPDYIHARESENLRIASLNRPGSIATDFLFLKRDGSMSTLHEFEADKLILIFYDPECPHCSDILKALEESEVINEGIRDKSMAVLAIYAEGKRSVWNKDKENMPANWVIGYDMSSIVEKELYDLPAMPIIYLLDKDKRVVLKDPDPIKLLKENWQ